MKTKKILSAILAGVMILTSVALFAGCLKKGSKESDQSSNSDAAKQNEFDFSKIEWTTSRERKFGKLQQVIEFTNNSDYSILNLKINFELKSDTTDEDLKVFDDYINEDEIKEEEVRDIYIVGRCTKFIKQGGSETGSLSINGEYYVKTEEQFSMVEPSEATVEYADSDKVYKVEYNYLTKKSKVVGEPKPAYNWSKTALGDQIPKLNCDVTSVLDDSDTSFLVDGYDYSQAKTDEYVEECKKMGFAVDDVLFSSITNLKKDGLKLQVIYVEEAKKITVSLKSDKPIEATTQKATQ